MIKAITYLNKLVQRLKNKNCKIKYNCNKQSKNKHEEVK